ncbi:MAG TPA: hypothetical protein VFF78_06525 [Anaerolineaceae bacterium]|nr:hypothetical protein [Anaerolineaceae bacterium]
MKRIYTPTTSPEDWRALLADPAKQWRSGYSAKELAECWEQADGFPAEFQHLFAGSDNPALRELELLLAIPEYKVDLPDGKHPSQNDLFVLARAQDNQLVSIMVEGKVCEPFGGTIEVWRKDGSAGKKERLKMLCQILGLPADLPGTIRYQLLHRTASAIITAERFNARYAMMVVHSFSPEHQWLAEYQAFLGLYGVKSGVNELVKISEMDGRQVYSGWVTGQLKTV